MVAPVSAEQDALLDELFRSCLLRGSTESASVAGIVDYLRSLPREGDSAGIPEHELAALRKMLDPDGTGAVSLDTYRRQMVTWIALQAGVYDTGALTPTGASPVGSPVRTPTSAPRSNTRGARHGASPGAAAAEFDAHLRRLRQENGQLKGEMERLYEENARLSSDCERLRRELRQERQSKELAQQMRRENDELRGQLSEATAEARALRDSLRKRESDTASSVHRDRQIADQGLELAALEARLAEAVARAGECDALRERLRLLTLELATARGEADEAAEDASRLASTVVSLSARVDHLQAELLERSAAEDFARHTGGESVLRIADAVEAVVRREHDGVSAALGVVDEIARDDDHMSLLEESMIATEGQLRAAEEAVRERDDRLAVAAARIATLTAQAEAALSQADASKRELSAVRAELDRANVAAATAAADANAARREADIARRESEVARSELHESLERVEREAAHASSEVVSVLETRVALLERQLHEQNELLSDRAAELAVAHAALDAGASGAGALQTKYEGASAALQASERNLSHATARVQQLEAELKGMKARIADLTAEAQEREAALQRELQQDRQTRELVQQLHRENDDLRDRLTEAVEESRALHESLLAREADSTAADEDRAAQTAHQATLEARLGEALKRAAECDALRERLELSLLEAETRRASDDTATEAAGSPPKASADNAAVAELMGRLAELERTVEEYETSLAQKDAELSDAQAALASSDVTCRELQRECDAARSAADRALRDMRGSSGRVEQLEADLQGALGRIADLNARDTAMAAELRDLLPSRPGSAAAGSSLTFFSEDEGLVRRMDHVIGTLQEAVHFFDAQEGGQAHSSARDVLAHALNTLNGVVSQVSLQTRERTRVVQAAIARRVDTLVGQKRDLETRLEETQQQAEKAAVEREVLRSRLNDLNAHAASTARNILAVLRGLQEGAVAVSVDRRRSMAERLVAVMDVVRAASEDAATKLAWDPTAAPVPAEELGDGVYREGYYAGMRARVWGDMESLRQRLGLCEATLSVREDAGRRARGSRPAVTLLVVALVAAAAALGALFTWISDGGAECVSPGSGLTLFLTHVLSLSELPALA